MGKRYSPSNKFNVALVILFFIFTTIISFFLTGVAALVGLWLVPPYSGMVLVFFSSWGIYNIQKKAIIYSQNRNVGFSRILILVSSLLTAFFHMSSIASISDVMRDTIQNIMPSLGIKTIIDIFIGAIVLFKEPAKVILAFFSEKIGISWSIYFFVIIFSNILVPQLAAEQASKPFSEESHTWMNEVYSIGRFEPFPDREQHTIVSAMKREDLFPFLERPRCNAQDPVDYGMLIFYKARNIHSGYVGVHHFHQLRNSKGELIPNQYQMIEFIPPIQVGAVYALKLETAVNSTAMIGQSSYFSKYEEEAGYKLYRTASEAADYQYNIKREKTPASENSRINSQEEKFYFDQNLK